MPVSEQENKLLPETGVRERAGQRGGERQKPAISTVLVNRVRGTMGIVGKRREHDISPRGSTCPRHHSHEESVQVQGPSRGTSLVLPCNGGRPMRPGLRHAVALVGQPLHL